MTDRDEALPLDDPEGNRVEDGDRLLRRAMLREARALHFNVAEIDCSSVAGKQDVFDAFAVALRFPEWFGDNWDALVDCLADLSWWPAPGYLILLDDSAAWRAKDGADFDQLREILEDSADAWRVLGIPFHVVYATRNEGLPAMPGSGGAT